MTEYDIMLKNRFHQITGLNLGMAFPPRLGLLAGITPGKSDLDKELAKIQEAKALGIDTITDLTTIIDSPLRKVVLQKVDIPLGTVPVYEIFLKFKEGKSKDLRKLTLSVLESQAKQGVDFFSLHPSITRQITEQLSASNRVIPVTSRGGAMMIEMMTSLECENPFYENLDDILALCREYNITLSLVGTLRPGSIADAFEPLHLTELIVQGNIVNRAIVSNVQTMVELVNHVSLSAIPKYCELGISLFRGVPLGALGPTPTDIAVGYDDVAGAIGAAVAVSNGVSWINCVTAAEHNYLPKYEDTVQAIKYFKIAAHIGYIARSGDIAQDKKLSFSRNINDWDGIACSSIFPNDAREIFEEHGYKFGQPCDMCHAECPLVRTRKILATDSFKNRSKERSK